MTARVVITPTQSAVKWAVKHLGPEIIESPEEFGPCMAFGIAVDGKPAAAIVFNDFRKMKYGNDIRITVVAARPGWCTRPVLRTIFEYAFKTAGCTRITSLLKEGNSKSIRITEGVGFRKNGVVPRGWNGKSNAILYSMLKEQCKWIR